MTTPEQTVPRVLARLRRWLPKALRGDPLAEPDLTFVRQASRPYVGTLAPDLPSASTDLRESVGRLLKAGALDEGNRRAFDSTIDGWVDEWALLAESEHQRRQSVLRRIEVIAEDQAETLRERGELLRRHALELTEREREVTARRSGGPTGGRNEGIVTTQPTQATGTAAERGRRPLHFSWLPARREQFVMLAVLALMAVADAYGFWTTLDRLFQKDSNLVLTFVVAISLGSVAAAHKIGQMARTWSAGYRAGVTAMVVLGVLWLGLGLAMSVLRATVPLTASRFNSAPASATDPNALKVAALLLLVYLMTGGLAMTHAYRFADPDTAEVRDLRRRRHRLEADIAEVDARARLVRARQRLAQEDRQREENLHEREQESADARRRLLGSAMGQQTAEALGDPSATDALLDPGFDDADADADADDDDRDRADPRTRS